MSITISTPELINKCPHNNSSAKYLWSFPKSTRFDGIQKSESMDKIYTLPGTLNKRTTSFGFGKKYDFTAHVKNYPAPGHYPEIDRMYRFNKHGLTMAPGRKDVRFNDFFQIGEIMYTPAPGKYCPETYRKHVSQGVSLKSRYDTNLRASDVPGPGHYSIEKIINGTGYHPSSKYRDYLPTVIAGTGHSAANYNNGIPGPGTYDNRILIGGTRAILSTKKSIVDIKFRTSQKGWIKSGSDIPGPGEYRLPSDFGHYLSKSALGTQANSHSSSHNASRLKPLQGLPMLK